MYASTIGKDHFKELQALLLAFEPNVDFHPEKGAKNFGLENGKELLSEYFGKIEMNIYEDSLIVPEVDSIVEYVMSTSGNAKSLFSGEKLENLYRYLENELSKHSTITISKSSGMFKARG